MGSNFFEPTVSPQGETAFRVNHLQFSSDDLVKILHCKNMPTDLFFMAEWLEQWTVLTATSAIPLSRVPIPAVTKNL